MQAVYDSLPWRPGHRMREPARNGAHGHCGPAGPIAAMSDGRGWHLYGSSVEAPVEATDVSRQQQTADADAAEVQQLRQMTADGSARP